MKKMEVLYQVLLFLLIGLVFIIFISIGLNLFGFREIDNTKYNEPIILCDELKKANKMILKDADTNILNTFYRDHFFNEDSSFIFYDIEDDTLPLNRWQLETLYILDFYKDDEYIKSLSILKARKNMKNLELFDLENTWLLHNDTYLLLSSDF